MLKSIYILLLLMNSISANKIKFTIDENIFHSIDYYTKLPKRQTCIYKPPSEISLQPNQRILVIGDIHGEFYALLYALYKAKVIDKGGRWIGKNTLVVQIGDQIDKGGRGIEIENDDCLEELKIMEFLHDLHFKAVKFKGGVYNLIGNHEIMNVMGDFRYVSHHHIKGFQGVNIRKKLFEPGGQLAQKLACHTNGILKIGNWIFVHAGLLPEHIENYSIQDINNTIRELLLGNLSFDTIHQEIKNILLGGKGFLWDRTYSNQIDSTRCEQLDRVMQILHIGKQGGMVVGHTVKNTITSDCNGKLWMTDTGYSTAFGEKKGLHDRIEVLEIIDNGRKINKI